MLADDDFKIILRVRKGELIGKSGDDRHRSDSHVSYFSCPGIVSNGFLRHGNK